VLAKRRELGCSIDFFAMMELELEPDRDAAPHRLRSSSNWCRASRTRSDAKRCARGAAAVGAATGSTTG